MAAETTDSVAATLLRILAEDYDELAKEAAPVGQQQQQIQPKEPAKALAWVMRLQQEPLEANARSLNVRPSAGKTLGSGPHASALDRGKTHSDHPRDDRRVHLCKPAGDVLRL